jgi:hypothetical protein
MAPPTLIPGGVPLEQVAGLTPVQIQTLHDLWVSTVQEFVGLAETEPSRVLLARALGVSQAALFNLLQAAQAVLPVARSVRSLALAAAAVTASYGRGAVPPQRRRGGQAAILAYSRAAAPVALPENVSLLPNLPPLRDQGERGTCVAQAVCALREQLEIMAGSAIAINLSEQYIYWWCKQNDGIPAAHGTYLATGMQCLASTGVPWEAAWPYNPQQQASEGQGPPPLAAAQGDPAFRTIHTVTFNSTDITGIKTRLLEGKLVAFSVPVFDTWYSSLATMRWGKITLPLPGEANDGGHAMVIVGYQDDPSAPGGGYFIIRNSWHPWSYEGVWQSGYGYIPYAYITSQAWEIASAERLATMDLAVHDNETDTGTRPLAGLTWDSPDVWVRHAPDGSPTHQAPIPGQINWLYVRIANLGPAYAYHVSVNVLAAPLAARIEPANWQIITHEEESQVPPGDRVFGPLPWTPSAEATTQYAFQIQLNSQADRLGANLDPQANNNVTEKHLWLAEAEPGQPVQIAFPVSEEPLAGEETSFTIDHVNVPPDVTITRVQWQPFAVPGSVEVREASLTVTPPVTAAPGNEYRFTVSQMAGLTTVGRLTVRVLVAG